MLAADKKFMQRCFDLARLGTGSVSPNPLVGAVLVHNNRIIGEGFHQRYGGPHAEVNAVRSVAEEDRHLIPASTLYVSLEPCCVYGKTPPCSSLIIENKIPRVVLSSLDQTPGVNGESIKILQAAGVEVVGPIMEESGMELSVIRNTFVAQQRPYIYLKYAQTADFFMGKQEEQVWISNALSKRLTHKWRSESAAILVGTNTALTDNPQLNTRYFFGPSPLRIVLDRSLKVPDSYYLFDRKIPTWIIHEQADFPPSEPNLEYIPIPFDEQLLSTLLDRLYQAGKSTLIVEGGARLLQSFITAELWDEAHVFVSDTHLLEGISAPILPRKPTHCYDLGDNQLMVYHR